MTKLNQNQLKTARKIVRIGQNMGKSDAEIKIALKVAYIESSLGSNKGKNPKSSAR